MSLDNLSPYLPNQFYSQINGKRKNTSHHHLKSVRHMVIYLSTMKESYVPLVCVR